MALINLKSLLKPSIEMRSADNNLQDIFPNSLELAQIMKNDPSFIESSLSEKGSAIIDIYIDPKFTKKKFRIYYELKLETIRSAIEDLSVGAPTMKKSCFCLIHRDNKLHLQVVPRSSPSLSEGILFSITLKDKDSELTEDLINIGIYYLTIQLSKMI